MTAAQLAAALRAQADALRLVADAIETREPQPEVDPDQLLTVSEAASLLAISPSQLRRLVGLRALAAVRIGKREIRIGRRALLIFAKSREQSRTIRRVGSVA